MALSNLDIGKLVDQYGLERYFRGCWSKDTYKLLDEDHFRIINLQDDKDGSGTHWVMYFQVGSKVYYFDSFGFPPYQRLVDDCRRLKFDLVFSSKKYQTDDFSCGYWCLREVLKILSK